MKYLFLVASIALTGCQNTAASHADNYRKHIQSIEVTKFETIEDGCRVSDVVSPNRFEVVKRDDLCLELENKYAARMAKLEQERIAKAETRAKAKQEAQEKRIAAAKAQQQQCIAIIKDEQPKLKKLAKQVKATKAIHPMQFKVESFTTGQAVKMFTHYADWNKDATQCAFHSGFQVVEQVANNAYLVRAYKSQMFILLSGNRNYSVGSEILDAHRVYTFKYHGTQQTVSQTLGTVDYDYYPTLSIK